MKKAKWFISAAGLIILAGIIVTACMTTDTANGKSDTENQGKELTAQITASESAGPEGEFKAESPNKTLEASVIRQDGEKFDAVLITGQNRQDRVSLENIFYTSVMSLVWIDDTRVALLGHLNPSSDVYVIVNAETLSVDGSYYGIGFTWNKSLDRLYYVHPKPHFSSEFDGSDKLVDSEGNVYYETDTGSRLTEQLIISDNEKSITFTIRDRKTEEEQSVTIDQNRISSSR